MPIRLPRLAGFEPAPRRGKDATWPLSVVLGWLLAGLANIGVELSAPPTAVQRAFWLPSAVDLGRHLAFGLASAAVVWSFRRHLPGAPLLAWLGFLLLGIALGALILPTDLEGLAERSAEEWQLSEGLVIAAIVVIVGAAVPAIAAATLPRWSGAGVAQRVLSVSTRLAAAALAVAAFWLNVNTSPGSNPSAHLYLSWATAVCAAHALPRLELPVPGRRRVSWAALLALSGWALWALFGAHSNGVMIQIARRPSSLHLVALFNTDGGLDTVEASLASRAGPFFARREGLPAVPPTPRSALPGPPIVIFFSIDSLRGDVPNDARHSKFMPQLVDLMNQGAAFSNARAPGSMTKYTLASISSGRYFSQQNWGGVGKPHWPIEDTSVHLATLLSQAGVFTAAFPAASWLENRTGVMRGFEHNTWTGNTPGRKQHWVGGQHLTRELIEKLERESARPGFYWVHYLDSHEPFAKAGRGGKKFDRYLRAVRVVDGYLGELRAAVTRLGLDERVLWVLMSDHGEAFGEHGSHFHGSTVYDELLRVPLVIQGRGVAAREVPEPVSLIDLGPTVLDWFGLPTPASFMGESLVPLLIGKSRAFSRPIVAETRLKQSMVFADQRKVIRDLRRRTLEIYDLGRDPAELENLSDDLDAEQDEHVLLMRSFFQVHTYRENGYRVPYVK